MASSRNGQIARWPDHLITRSPRNQISHNPMVLVAVTGPVVPEKQLCSHRLSSGGRNTSDRLTVSGSPHDRLAQRKGAQEYLLQMVASGKMIPFARRDESFSPPYRINPLALSELTDWATVLAGLQPLSLLALDEFGPLEARGHGHMQYWEILRKSNPEVVAIAVRDNSIREIEQTLGVVLMSWSTRRHQTPSRSFRLFCFTIPIGHAWDSLEQPPEDSKRPSARHSMRRASRLRFVPLHRSVVGHDVRGRPSL